MNITQRILKLLATMEDATTKTTIARSLNTTENYIAKGIADLVRGNYVRQSKGLYRITPKGLTTYKEDPELLAFFVKRPVSSKVAFSLPIREIGESGICRDILNMGPEQIATLGKLNNGLMPFLVLWLKINGIAIPEITWRIDPDEPNIKTKTDLFERFLRTLVVWDDRNLENNKLVKAVLTKLEDV